MKYTYPFKNWLKYLVLSGAITLAVIAIYNHFAPFYGINPHAIANTLYYPAKYFSMLLLIISLLTFARSDQRHQAKLLKLSLLPASYGIFAFLLKGNMHDFAWFLLMTALLQTLNFFIIFSDQKPIGKTAFVSTILLFIGLFGTDALHRLPPQKNLPPKPESSTTPSPTPTPYLYREYSQTTIAPVTRTIARIKLINTEQPNAPHIVLTFQDHINHRGREFEYEYRRRDDPPYAWSPAGNKFALYDGNVIRIYTIHPTPKNKLSKEIEIETMEIKPESWIVGSLIFAGDNQTLYYIRTFSDSEHDPATHTLIALNTTTQKQYIVAENVSQAYPLPNQLGYATVSDVGEYKHQVSIVTPRGKRTFSPIFESDYIFDLFVSPSLNSFCLNDGSSGGKWYNIVSGDKIVKRGDGACKGWIDDHTILLDESPWDQPAVESIYNLTTNSYTYQSEIK